MTFSLSNMHPVSVAVRVFERILAVAYLYKAFYAGSSQFSFTDGMDWLWIVTAFIAGNFYVDCIGAVIHFHLDNYGTKDTPIVGEAIYYFRLHHEHPRKMLERDFVDTNTDITNISILHALIFYPIQLMFPFLDSAWINLAIGSALLLGPFVNTVHACMHKSPKEQPLWYKTLSKMGLCCSPDHHKDHHIEFDRSYSLYLGKVDPLFEYFCIWEILETIYYVFLGEIAEKPRIGQWLTLDASLPTRDRFQYAFWNYFYALFSWYFKAKGIEVRSMNWGYHCNEQSDEEKRDSYKTFELSEKQIMKQVLPGVCSDIWQVEKFSLQLYRKNVSAVKGGLAGKDVADVSCGKGGGIRCLSELGAGGDKKTPNSVIGMDFSPVNVRECQTSYDGQIDHLSFQCGSAEKMPFEDNSKDVIVSVEASHCYPDKIKFLKEAKRVLRKGGRLCIVDFMRMEKEVDNYRKLIADAGLVLERDETILPEVIAASRKCSAVKVALIERLMPRYMWYLSKRFCNTADSVTFHKFTSGVYDYRWFVIKDPKA